MLGAPPQGPSHSAGEASTPSLAVAALRRLPTPPLPPHPSPAQPTPHPRMTAPRARPVGEGP